MNIDTIMCTCAQLKVNKYFPTHLKFKLNFKGYMDYRLNIMVSLNYIDL